MAPQPLRQPQGRAAGLQVWAHTYPSAAVLQQDVDVLFVLEVVVELNDVLVVQKSVQLYLLVDLGGKADKAQHRGGGSCVLTGKTGPEQHLAQPSTVLTFSRW